MTTLIAVWPILDTDRTRTELIAEATDLLPEVAEQTGCMVDGPSVWEVRAGVEVPGWSIYDLVLVCTVPARAVPMPKRRHGSPTAHIALIRRLAGDGQTDAQIADVVGCSESGVAKARVRARPPIAPGVGNPTLGRTA